VEIRLDQAVPVSPGFTKKYASGIWHTQNASTLIGVGVIVSAYNCETAVTHSPEYHRASMSTDEDVIAELADDTGGTYFHNTNDPSPFRKLATAPEYLYLLEFSPRDVKQDGSFHGLKVKANSNGVNVKTRRGYFAPKGGKK
jgi:VWFA-related protein